MVTHILILFIWVIPQYSLARSYPDILHCPKQSAQKEIGVVNPDLLPPPAQHCQGDTDTCAFHAAGALLNAAFRYANSSCDQHLNVLDVILQQQETVDSPSDTAAILWNIRKRRSRIALGARPTVDDAHRAGQFFRTALQPCLRGECSRRLPTDDHGDCLDDHRVEESIAPMLAPLTADIRAAFDILAAKGEDACPVGALTHASREPSRVEIPPYQVQEFFFEPAERSMTEQAIIEHFTKLTIPLLPLGINFCAQDGVILDGTRVCKDSHATTVKSLIQITCKKLSDGSETIHTGLLFHDSGGLNVPVSLTSVLDAMALDGSLVTIHPCTPDAPCPERLMHEEDPHSRPLCSFAAAGDVEKVREALASTNPRDNPNLATPSGDTPLILATKHHRLSVITELLGDRRVDGTYALFIAVDKKKRDITAISFEKPNADKPKFIRQSSSRNLRKRSIHS